MHTALRTSLRLALTGCLACVPAFAQTTLDAAGQDVLRTLMDDSREIVRDFYYPSDKITPAFKERCAETKRALGRARSLNEGYALIADTLGSLDPRIRLHPPSRKVRIDYSWDWQIVGDAAYVIQVDREGDAARQGLQRGDRIVSFEGIPLARENYQQVYYAMNGLAPRPGLRIQVQSPSQEPRWLSIASTGRPQRRFRTVGTGASATLERVYTVEENRRFDEFLDPKSHVRRVGQVAVWQADELRRDARAVTEGLKLLQGASGLILDLRGQYIRRHEPVLRMLDGLFAESFDVGTIQSEERLDKKLHVSGDQVFAGMVLVLIDSETVAYAEVLARVIQQRQRGVIIGDRSMGRVFEEALIGTVRGTDFNFNIGGLGLPVGTVMLADGVQLDGRGVAPDYQLLPAPADWAGRRDIVMSKALAMLKETLSPEEAYKLFPHYEDVDDDF